MYFLSNAGPAVTNSLIDSPAFRMAITILLAVIASSGFWAFLQSRLLRHDTVHDALEDIKADLKSLHDTIDENDTITARNRILRFDDELTAGIPHDRQYFRSILEDIDRYEKYCELHPNFKNSYTISAVIHIRSTYQKLLEKGEFQIKDD